MKNLFLPFALALSTLLGCNTLSGGGAGNSSKPVAARTETGGAAPSWVGMPGSHPKYPLSRYMIGVGQAAVDGNRVAAAEKAGANGRKKISEELNSKLQAVTEDFVRVSGTDQDSEMSFEYIERIKNSTESMLYGSTEGAQYYDSATDSMYVLVVLDRETHAKTLLGKVDTALAKAVPSNEQGTATGALRALIAEHVAIEEVMPALLTLEVVVKPKNPIYGRFQQRNTQARSRLKAIYKQYRDANISLDLVSGGGQQGYADGELSEPMVFEASFRGQPLVGFPVAFSLEHPTRAEISQASTQTGSDGQFSCKVVGLQLTGDEENGVSGMLDYAALGEQVFAVPQATATFKLPTLRTVTFSILIDETNLGQALPDPPVTGQLKRALGQREVRLVAIESYLSGSDLKQAATMSPKQLKQKLNGKVDYLIRGSARSRVGQKKTSPPYFCYGGGSLELIDVRTGQQLQTLVVPPTGDTIKGASNSEYKGGIAALNAFAKMADEKFMGEIDSIFGTK